MNTCPDCGKPLVSSKTGKPVTLTTHYIYKDCPVFNLLMLALNLSHLRGV